MKNKKIIFLSNIDSFFVSHRLKIADKLKKEGFDVHIATEFTIYKKFLKKKGFKIHEIKFSRNSLNILKAVVPLLQIFYMVLKVKPHILHLISLKPIIFGGLISIILPVKSLVISITGLGSMFLYKNFLNKARENFIKFLLKLIFSHPKLKIIFQNKYDYYYLKNHTKITRDKICFIKGSGVDLQKFKFTKVNTKEINIMLISRIIAEKGIYEYINAINYLKNKNFRGNFYLIGDTDYSNPSAIKISEIKLWKNEKIIKYMKYQDDIYNILKKSTIIVLPSYREGFPKILMEAAAVGRPVITTNVPGCRDAIINKKTGILVPPKNYIKLAKAMFDLSINKKKIIKFGIQGRKNAVNYFNVQDIVSKHLSIYKSLI